MKFLLFFLVLPVLLARIIGGNWRAVLMALFFWFGLLALLALMLSSRGSSSGEAIGWTLILGMFATPLAVPILAAILRAIRFGQPDPRHEDGYSIQLAPAPPSAGAPRSRGGTTAGP